ncbi:MAG: type 4a pilus biogenesis protein PilO [Longimicrobiales bacterium]
MALLPSNPNAQKRLILGLVPFIGLFMYYQLVHGKKVTEIETLEAQLETLTMTNNAAKALAAQGGPELEKRLAIYEQHARQLEELIPRREEVAELLHSMTLRAQSSGVDLTRMKPETEDAGTFYTKSIYEIGVKGTYNDIGQFLAEIGSLPRIVTPTDVRILKLATSGTARDGSPILDTSFRIVTYVLPEPVAAPADTTNANANANS